MTLDHDQAAGLASHVGYGSAQAPLWFVGTEEGLGGATSPEEDSYNLLARAAWLREMDMHLAHRTLKENGTFIDISRPRAGHIGVWQWMAKIARGFDGAADFCGTNKANAYIRSSIGLGRTEGTTFLTELRPFPAKRADQPPALQHFGDAAALDRLLERRRERQLRFLREGVNKCVICYGSSARARFARHFAVAWEPLATYHWTSFSKNRRSTVIWQAFVEMPEFATVHFFMLPFLGHGALCEDVLRQFVSSDAFQACRSRIR